MERKRKPRYTPVIILLAAFVMLTVALIGQNFWFGEERTQEAAVALLDNDSFTQASGTAADGEESGKAECLYLWARMPVPSFSMSRCPRSFMI